MAEVSANHAGKIDTAISMIKKAKECGADAVKFQVYTPDTLTINADNKYFMIRHPKWGGQTLYELYKNAHTPWGWFKRLKKAADDARITFFATAFDRTAIDLLEELKVPFHKIASFELVDLPLVEYAAKTKKPLIMSTGMASRKEIGDAVDTARKAGAKDMILMKCVSSYPASCEEMNLATIPDMARSFKCLVGLSDHTTSVIPPVVAVSLGARIIEKHFTLSRGIRTEDSFFSIEPAELKEMVRSVRLAEEALGRVHYGVTKEEEKNRIFRRSLFAVKDIGKGEPFTEENIRSIRPGYGISPKHITALLGRPAARPIKAGTPLNMDLVK